METNLSQPSVFQERTSPSPPPYLTHSQIGLRIKDTENDQKFRGIQGNRAIQNASIATIDSQKQPTLTEQ